MVKQRSKFVIDRNTLEGFPAPGTQTINLRYNFQRLRLKH